MTLDEYMVSIQNKTVSVIGIGVSNTPLIKKLLNSGIHVTARDKHSYEELKEQIQESGIEGCKFILGNNYLSDLKEDIIFRTPGLRPDVKEIREALANGSTLTSEMELFFELCPCKIIGITGSDGKTTTTSIIAGILKKEGHTVHIGGNIGKPLLCDVDSYSSKDFAVVELSSFQLLTMKKSPDISIITNIAPNHLDVHKDMNEYIDAKKNIIKYQSKDGLSILNDDCELTRSICYETNGNLLKFSRTHFVPNGAFLKDNKIELSSNSQVETLLDINNIKIPGMHNVENYMAAILAVNPYVKNQTIVDFASEFGGVEHRIEFIRNYKGVKYYNDSIASSPTRTIAGLHSFNQKVILIAGGYDKHIPFDILGPEICNHVKILVLCGATSQKIEESVLKSKEYSKSDLIIKKADTLHEAAEIAKKFANNNDIVTLSPACAAFDQFKNFMVRGNTFKEIVNGWK